MSIAAEGPYLVSYDICVLFLRYNAFDFHKECSKMRWDRLSILINRLDKRQTEFS